MSGLLHVYDWPSLLIEIGLVALFPLVWWFNRWYFKRYGGAQGSRASVPYYRARRVDSRGGVCGMGSEVPIRNVNGTPLVGTADLYGVRYPRRD